MIDQSDRDAFTHLPRAVVFVRVVMSGSFRGAARALGVSPGTVSHHIKVLEESMEVRLLERSTRQMSLTTAGQAFYDEVRPVLRCWEHGVSAAQRFAGVAAGSLVITLPDVWLKFFINPIVAELARTHPDVTVDLRVSSTNADLLADGVHIALRAGPLADSGYGVRALGGSHHRIYAAPSLAAQWHSTHPSQLASAPWIHFARRNRSVHLQCVDGDEHTLEYVPRVVSDSPLAAIDLAVDGLGFILLPSILASGWLATNALVPVLPSWAGELVEFHAVTPSPRPTDQKVQLFMRLLQQEFARAEYNYAAQVGAG